MIHRPIVVVCIVRIVRVIVMRMPVPPIVIVPSGIIRTVIPRIPSRIIACGPEPPVPPQRIGKRWESIGIGTINIDIPIKCRCPIENVKIQRAGHVYGNLGTGKPHQPYGIFIV